jgi:hypothetical protein
MRFDKPAALLLCGLTFAPLLPTAAAANPQPVTGACCIDWQPCRIVMEAECLVAGGHWMGDFTTCNPDPCVGGCCTEMGTCIVADYVTCVAPMGYFLGYGSTCQPDPCHTGACCLPGGACVSLDESVCVAEGGVFTDDFYPCSLEPCVEVGACCRSDQTCVLSARSLCSHGWLGEGSTCTPNPCPTAGAGSEGVRGEIPWTVAPNPFARTTTLRFGAGLAGPVLAQAIDVMGRVVWSAPSEKAGGQMEWDGRDQSGRPVPAGAYFMRVRIGAATWTRLVVRVE